MENDVRILESIDTKKVFSINELSKSAYDSAYYRWYDNLDYPYEKEYQKTLNTFCEVFKIKIISLSSIYRNSFYMQQDDEIDELSGIRLLKYLYNNYFDKLFPKKVYHSKNGNKERTSNIYYDFCSPLTGHSFDETILLPIYEFFEEPNENINFYELIDRCLDIYLEEHIEDYQTWGDEEHFIEYCKENKILFDEKGTVLNS